MLVEVLSAKARAVGAAELLRESMKCAANAWALAVALNGLDDWTLAQIRPDAAAQPEVGQWFERGQLSLCKLYIRAAVSICW